MFDRFRETYGSPTEAGSQQSWMPPVLARVTGYSEIASDFAGATFGSGLYRVHGDISGPLAVSWLHSCFAGHAGRVAPIGFDWLGRQFALFFRAPDSEPSVLMFEPGTSDVFEVAENFVDFYERTLIEDQEPALALSFFEEWRAEHPEPISHNQSVGYTVPLFLGGSDDIANLALTDSDVYWSLTAQLIAQVGPEG